MGGVNWDRLTEPFPAEDVEWRIGRAGVKGDKPWATVLAYITARAIQARLDEVFGPDGWKNEYREGPGGGVICRIWFRNDDGEWSWREDGAENTDIEAVKGGLSGALKRAGSALGIGRYLYKLDEGWANIHARGQHYQSKNEHKGIPAFKWDPPELPEWALPNGNGKPEATKADPETGEVEEEPTEGPGEAPIAVQVEELKNKALDVEAITNKQATGIDRKLDSGDKAVLFTARDWLVTQIEAKKVNDPSTHPDKQGVAA